MTVKEESMCLQSSNMIRVKVVRVQRYNRFMQKYFEAVTVKDRSSFMESANVVCTQKSTQHPMPKAALATQPGNCCELNRRHHIRGWKSDLRATR